MDMHDQRRGDEGRDREDHPEPDEREDDEEGEEENDYEVLEDDIGRSSDSSSSIYELRGFEGQVDSGGGGGGDGAGEGRDPEDEEEVEELQHVYVVSSYTDVSQGPDREGGNARGNKKVPDAPLSMAMHYSPTGHGLVAQKADDGDQPNYVPVLVTTKCKVPGNEDESAKAKTSASGEARGGGGQKGEAGDYEHMYVDVVVIPGKTEEEVNKAAGETKNEDSEKDKKKADKTKKEKKKKPKTPVRKGLSKKDLRFDRKWNAEYQSYMEQNPSQMDVEGLRKTSRLVHDFANCAETYARVIINELNVSPQSKTIKPANVGGVAGGEKFIVQGILFKFCVDPLISTKPQKTWLYGGHKPSDYRAMKAAGLELQGLCAITMTSVAGIYLPLMMLIDYKGFRMIATSLLPVGEKTIIYGSNDGGRTVHASEEKFSKLMEEVGNKLFLKKHKVGKQGAQIIGPGDIEGHKGNDDRFYLLDLARLMPPQLPIADDPGKPLETRAVFYQKLRPELLQRIRTKLSSDAFTGWSAYDEEKEKSEDEVREATRVLLEECIPEAAKEIDELNIHEMLANVLEHFDEESSTTPEAASCRRTNPVEYLTRANEDSNIKVSTNQIKMMLDRVCIVVRLHGKGVNLRHLGRLRQHLKDRGARVFVMSEAVARVFKTKVRKRMREALRSKEAQGVSSEATCILAMMELMNRMAGRTPPSQRFWTVSVKKSLQKMFPGILTPEEADPSFDLRKGSCSRMLIGVMVRKMRIGEVTEELRNQLWGSASLVTCVESDFLSVPCNVKPGYVILTLDLYQMHLLDGFLQQAEANQPGLSDQDRLRLLLKAKDSFAEAAGTYPACAYAFWRLALVEAAAGAMFPYGKEFEWLMAGAHKHFKLTQGRLVHAETSKESKREWAKTLDLHATKLEEAKVELDRAKTMREQAAKLREETSKDKSS